MVYNNGTVLKTLFYQLFNDFEEKNLILLKLAKEITFIIFLRKYENC